MSEIEIVLLQVKYYFDILFKTVIWDFEDFECKHRHARMGTFPYCLLVCLCNNFFPEKKLKLTFLPYI